MMSVNLNGYSVAKIGAPSVHIPWGCLHRHLPIHCQGCKKKMVVDFGKSFIHGIHFKFQCECNSQNKKEKK